MSPSTTARALASTPPSPSQSTAAERKSVAEEGPPNSGTINRTGLHLLEGFTLHTYYLECLASVVSLL